MAKKVSKDSSKKGNVKKPANVKTPMSKSELFNTLAEMSELKATQVKKLYANLQDIIASHFGKNGPQQFVLPGLAKIAVKHKPATKARKGTNPFTGEETQFKAKPARNVIKIKPLKSLKAMV
jgi:nucleoid DNA-binding protein